MKKQVQHCPCQWCDWHLWSLANREWDQRHLQSLSILLMCEDHDHDHLNLQIYRFVSHTPKMILHTLASTISLQSGQHSTSSQNLVLAEGVEDFYDAQTTNSASSLPSSNRHSAHRRIYVLHAVAAMHQQYTHQDQMEDQRWTRSTHSWCLSKSLEH